MLGQQIIYLFLVLIVHDCVHATLKIDDISSRNSVKAQMKTSSGRQGLPERVEGESQGIVPEYNKSDHQPKTSSKSDIKYTQSDEKEATWQTHSKKNKYLREDDESDGLEYKSTWKSSSKESEDSGDDTDRDTRSLSVGDTFTTSEMLEVAKRLIKKVTISNGKGIISSAKNPYQLAEILFGAVFKTSKAIVVIQEDELATLDALQALSLHGDVIYKLRSSTESFTQSPVIYIDGNIEPVDFTYRCHYKVLRKPIDENATNKSDKHVSGSFYNPRRRKITNLLKKLAKHQKLMGNTTLRGDVQNIKKTYQYIKHLNKQSNKTGRIKKQKRIPKARRYRVARQKNHRRKNIHSSSKKLQHKKSHKRHGVIGKSNVICRWVYACSLNNLESCRLHPRCMSKKEDVEGMGYRSNIVMPWLLGYADSRTNGEPIFIQQFRKMAGIDAIDEEVEKILEMQIIASNLKSQKSPLTGRIESLGEYFERVLSLRATTTPSSLRAKFVKKEISYKNGSQKTALLKSDTIRSLKVTKDDSDSEARKILGVTGPPVNVKY